MWADSGCVRGVGGKREHMKYRQHLARLNLKPIKASCKEQFQFGDGNVSEAICKYFYPVFLQQKYRGALDQAEVEVDCPQLLSKMVMKTWDVDLCFGKSLVKVHKFGVTLPFKNELSVVNIFDVDVDAIIKTWKDIPKHYKLCEQPPDHVPERTTEFWQNGKCIRVGQKENCNPQAVKRKVQFAGAVDAAEQQ